MAQFLRPDANVTQTSFTGGFAEIDEAVASDADKAFGADNVAAVLEVGLGNPTAAPQAGTTTIRYRIAKTKAGVLDGAGNAVTITCRLYQGATLIATDAVRTATGTWTTYSFTPSTAAVTDWNNLRLRFTTSASGGTTTTRRGGAISFAELEAPDPAGGVTHSGAIAASGAASMTATARRKLAGSAANAGTGSIGATARRKLAGSAASSGTGSIAASSRRKASAAIAAAGGSSAESAGRLKARSGSAIAGSATIAATARRKLAGSAASAGTAELEAGARSRDRASSSLDAAAHFEADGTVKPGRRDRRCKANIRSGL